MNHAAASPLRRVVLLACLGLAVSLISPVDGALRTTATAAPATTATAVTAGTAASVTATAAAMPTADDPANAAHPFSDPIWSPLRTPARVNCVRTNCPGNYHGFWAIDFIDPDSSTFDPIYASGAGIFHVGAVMGRDTCSPTGVASSGTWVWIDHGGSRTTMYTHLYDIDPNVKEGQLVTPATKIGRMGHNGNRAPCKSNYLHMEYRVHSVGGTRVPPRAMLACTGNGRVSMPSSLGYAAWDLVPTNQFPGARNNTKPDIYTPAATNACMATSRGAATPNRPIVSARRGPGSATIGWGIVPADVDHTLVTIQTWHPSLGRYSQPVNRTVTGRAPTTKFTGLLNGRPYRLRAATHNGAGYSAWTSYVTVTPAAAPAKTRAPRTLSTTRDSIRYSWWLPANNGRPITGFQVARRCVVGGSWSRWAYTRVAAHVNSSSWNLHYNWTRMPRGRACQVTVRALNSVGYGAWSVRSRATTRR